MSDEAAISTPVSGLHRQVIDRIAGDRGVAPEQIAGEMVAAASAQEAELLAALDDGRRQIARGEYMTHEAFVAAIEARKRDRRHAA